MELVSTMEISGEEREIADTYAREQCAANAKAIDSINSNLSDLAYGDNGGYNIFKDTTWFVGKHIAENGISNYVETGSAYSGYISIVEPNTYYISSFTHPKSTVFEYDANKSFIKYNGWKKDNNTPCVSSGNCAYIRISFSGASSNIQPSNVMLANTPNLPYVPYIPSVKMLADEVDNVNESLDLQGLSNLCDNIFKNGYINYMDGSIIEQTGNAVVTKNKIKLYTGEKLKIKYSKNIDIIRVCFYKDDNSFIDFKDSNNSSELDAIVPKETSYCYISISGNITTSNVEELKVYSLIREQVDGLKNDLSDSLPVGTILTVEADTPMSSDMWRFLNTGKMTYQNGGALVEMGTMIYQKIK